MSDKFASYTPGLESPASKHVALSAATGVAVDPRPRAIYCNAAGTITIRDEDGTDLPYTLIAGQAIPFRGVSIEAISGGTFYGWS